MRTRTHSPDSVPAPVGNYSLGLEIPAGSRILFISGQIPETLSGEIPQTFEDQCNLVWNHILSILGAAGMSAANLVKVTTFLVDREYAEANSRIRRERLGSHAPALTVMVAQTLDVRWLLEIEAVAAAEERT
ncbi:MAG TPA: RidA family protein [Thermoanaerobaculia bacterium]